eukprot:11229045-Heterocapsa_arctica.AAC.1
MTDIGLKEIEKSIAAEHVYNSKRYGDIPDDIEEIAKKRKKDEMTVDEVGTEKSEEEEEEQKTGAKNNDMNKWQKVEIKQWLDDHPERKADAMIEFDKKLMDDKGVELSQYMEMLSGRVFDALIGNPMIGTEDGCLSSSRPISATDGSHGAL